jgi:hypothetical protein
VIAHNHFTGLACVFVDDDHDDVWDNWFMGCGYASDGPWLQGVNQWPTNSYFWSGAAIALGPDGAIQSRLFKDNYFYFCDAGYYVPANVWPDVNADNNIYSEHDMYEGCNFSVLYYNLGVNWTGPFGSFNLFTQLNPLDAPDTACITNWVAGDDGFDNGALTLQQGTWPFSENAAGLTNVSSAALVGVIPMALMPSQVLTNNCTNVTLNGVTQLQSRTGTVTLGLSTATVGTSLSFNGTTLSTPVPFSASSLSGSGTGITGMTSGQISGLGNLATMAIAPNSSAPGQLLTSTSGGAGWSNAIVHKSVMDGWTVQPAGLGEFMNGIQAYGWRSGHSVVNVFTFDPTPFDQATAVNSGLTNYYIYAAFMTTNAMSQPTGISVTLGYSTNATSAGLVYYCSSISSNNVAFTSAAGTNSYTVKVPFSIPYGLATNLNQLQVWLSNNLSTANTNIYFLPGSYIANQ